MAARKLPENAIEQMKYMRHIERRTLQDIANEFGVTKQRVYQLIGKSGLIAYVPRGEPYIPPEKKG